MAEQPKPPQGGKVRASRIPLDYLKRPHPMDRPKKRWAWAAAIVALVWCAMGFVPRVGSDKHYSRGDVAAVHAAWDSRCDTCHDSFTAIGEKNWATGFMQRLLGNQDGWKGATHCGQCHAGPKHHSNEKWTPDCSECHTEHRGRDASLLRVPDQKCVQCHASLKENIDTGKKDGTIDCPCPQEWGHQAEGAGGERFSNNVTGFRGGKTTAGEDTKTEPQAGTHPEFRFVRDLTNQRDPSNLKFSHKVHMMEGFRFDGDSALSEEKKRAWFKIDQIQDEASRRRYSRDGQKPTDFVRMRCEDCHRLDGGDLEREMPTLDASARRGANLRRSKNSGDYMIPIRYEAHCKACHPFSVEGRPLPHGVQLSEIENIVREYLSRKFVEGTLTKRKTPFRVDEQEQALKDINANTAQVMTVTLASTSDSHKYSGCNLCHLRGEPSGKLPVAGTTAGGPDGLADSQRIQDTKVPQVWFGHAVFSHAAHRAMDCKQCHPSAYPDAPQPARDTEAIMLPGINVCLKCHSPAQGSGENATGGVRFDCVECHRYHNGDRPHQGIGAQARSATARLSGDEFIRGQVKATAGRGPSVEAAATPKDEPVTPAKGKPATNP